MTKYERYTKKDYWETKSLPLNYGELITRLWILENKIENGTLIEMPRIVRRLDMSCGYEDYLVQWEKDNGKIKSRIYNNERRAKAKLRELKE